MQIIDRDGDLFLIGIDSEIRGNRKELNGSARYVYLIDPELFETVKRFISDFNFDLCAETDKHNKIVGFLSTSGKYSSDDISTALSALGF